MGYGKDIDWGNWLLIGYSNSKLKVTFCDKSKSSSLKLKKNKWYKIDIVSNGITIEAYIDGDKAFDLEYKENEWYQGNELWLNRQSSGSSWGWSKSKFRLNDFRWYNESKDKEALQADYTVFKNKYKGE